MGIGDLQCVVASQICIMQHAASPRISWTIVDGLMYVDLDAALKTVSCSGQL